MKKAVVLGATGGMGYALVCELNKRQDIEVVAFARNEKKMHDLFSKMNKHVTMVTGDALKKEDIFNACKGANWIFHAINVPYPKWSIEHPKIMNHVLLAAKNENAKFIMIDNVYAYGRSNGKKVTEQTSKHPHTKKGKIRLQLEKMVKESKVKYLFAHFPDYYGPNAVNTTLHFTLKPIIQNKSALFVGPLHIPREYVYTPDGAKAAVELALRNDTYNEHWNIPGTKVITGHEIIRIVRELTGFQKKVRKVTKNMIALLGIFNQDMREVYEMMYLTEEPVVLSGQKYEKRIGALPNTPYEVGLMETIQYMKNHDSL